MMRMPRFVILSALVAGALSLSTFSHTPPRPLVADMRRAALSAPASGQTETDTARPAQAAPSAPVSTSLARAFAAPQQAAASVSPPVHVEAQADSSHPQTAATQASTHLLHMLENDGPEQTARTLTKSRKWSDVRLAVASGQPEAASMVAALMPEADPATALSLRAAMRRALPTHPAAVLAAMDQTDGPLFGARAVCSAQGMSRSWQSNARKAVASVHEIHLITRARDCMTRLGGLPQAG
ncbi:hypothetical protein [Acetobacter persici]|uniref:Secreted protein n=1 Tax=Acetobacter persici TaxID=1076596 RepID=A0A1U9LDM0_9PROT|nr:hypothetical protein [Acetobacter persici]AQT04487.1 hypothetical protein A0U91_05325 [Acetobacter persici]